MFYIDHIDGKKIVRSDLLKDVEHFFTTRDLCIFSKEEDMSYNVSIVESYLKEKMATNLPVHGVNISKIVDGQYYYRGTDGLLLDKKGAMYMSFGDCTPLVFYCDGVAVISHAGWRGTAQKMAQVTVNKLVDEYRFKVSDIRVVIGPAICEKCYDVSEEVYNNLYKTVVCHNLGFRKENGKFFVGIKDINKQQLLEVGVQKIDVCPYCTACGEKLFYSYRYENHTGYRHSAVIKL